MKKTSWLITLSLVAIMVIAGVALLRTEPPKPVDPHGHESGHEGEGQGHEGEEHAHEGEGQGHEGEEHAHESEGQGQKHGSEVALGRIRLSDEQLEHNDVRLATAGPGTISHHIELPGELVLNADKLAHIVPRFAGVVQKVFKNLGDRVAPGDVLAIVQSNESVAPYDVKSLIGGTIIEKHITLGEFVRDDADVFVVADLSSVWAQISVYAKYLSDVQPGQKVRLKASGIDKEIEGVIDYVGPLVGENTRTAEARIVLQNPQGVWRPGLFVTARVIVDEVAVPLAVLDEAIQTVEGRMVVFVREGESLEVRPITAGRSDGVWVEILAGLVPGEVYAASNSFILKAEFGKSEAGHDH